MPGFVGRDEVRSLVEERDAIVAEVLPRPEYDWAHLPGAIHLPLKSWAAEQIEAGLERDRPVIVYCNDYQ